MQSFRCIRAGIQRKIKEMRPEVDVVEDPDFTTCNQVFATAQNMCFSEKKCMAKLK